MGYGTTSLQHDYSILNDLSAVASPIIYYRLKQVDLDGKYYYSKIIALRLNKDKPLIISPNPFSKYLNINLDWNKDETVAVRVLNAGGKVMLRKNFQLTKGYNYIRIDDGSQLSKGAYILQVISADKKISGKIIKE